ncbi:MAG: enoyl-CoA hydratase/isomerase family protein [Candidatus Bathyarchaeota archaeon]|nr:enoyl-CoA hydratase/isomerase family protein [Candidatus Bathyarchaeum tardum]WGM90440.1 MAG: enoyl-CoA hydratase/isomerase family protein [Candidatus Bathyarchaeum tardum]WNZ29490.1 MAG: enoyl-CoA hydratase/isomerase family protein [Candidatus Bathyarchaeota archaeon]
MSNSYCTIKVHKKRQIAHIRFNRPDKLNAINSVMLQELSQAIDNLEIDKKIKCLVISGEGKKSFSAGADLTELQNLTKETARAFSINGQEVFSKIENMSKPVLASIKGYALGGGLELALACDFRISSDDAQFGFPEIKLGFIPGWGGTQRLPLIVGESKSKQLIMLGENIRSEEALKIGLVDTVVSSDDLDREIESFAQKLSECPPSACYQLKKTIFSNLVDDDFKKETASFVQLFLLTETKNKLADIASQRNKK